MRRPVLILFVISFLLFSVSACKKKEVEQKAQSPEVSSPEGAVAVYDGISVSAEELNDKLANDPQFKVAYYKIEKQRYDFMSRVADDLLLDKILEQKAKEKGMNEDEYLRDYFKEKFKGKEVPGMKSVENIDPRFLRMAYMRDLEEKGEIKVLLPEPEVPVVQIDIKGSPYKGPKKAKVTVVEFSDFQCPYCGRAVNTVKELIAKYPKDIKVVFKNMPLSFHQNSMGAAIAGVCANEQGKFWQMHDLMFQNQKNLGEADLQKYAGETGLNMSKFNKCIKSDSAKKAVEEDLKIAREIGVGGTPTFYVNGKIVSTPRSTNDFDPLIKEDLEK